MFLFFNLKIILCNFDMAQNQLKLKSNGTGDKQENASSTVQVIEKQEKNKKKTCFLSCHSIMYRKL